jgi:hypothetical protein
MMIREKGAFQTFPCCGFAATKLHDLSNANMGDLAGARYDPAQAVALPRRSRFDRAFGQARFEGQAVFCSLSLQQRLLFGLKFPPPFRMSVVSVPGWGSVLDGLLVLLLLVERNNAKRCRQH